MASQPVDEVRPTVRVPVGRTARANANTTMGRRGPRQGELLVTWDELPKGHAFCGRLQTVLADAGFDALVETLPGRTTPPSWARRRWRPGAAGRPRARAARPGTRPFVAQPEPRRLPFEVHERVFAWVLEQLAERGLMKGERSGRARAIPRPGLAACRTDARGSPTSVPGAGREVGPYDPLGDAVGSAPRPSAPPSWLPTSAITAAPS